MTQIAHIRNIEGVWTLVRRYTLDASGNTKGRVTFADGTVFMPPAVGQASGVDKIVPVETADDDQSTTALTETGVVTTVEETRVLDTTTTTDVAVTAAMVDAERERRLVQDFTFNGVVFQRDPAAVKRISGAGTLALAAIVGGAQPGDLRWHGEQTDFVWIAADNTLVPMDAHTMLAFGQAAAKVETALVFAAKALKAMDPIPADYATNEAYWTV